MSDLELETWIIESGDKVIEKKAAQGKQSLTQHEQLIYCVWVADYGMRNAGDLDTAVDLYPDFQREAALLAADLRLPCIRSAFELPTSELQKRYFDLFQAIVDELRG
jgi:hypothetical protein